MKAMILTFLLSLTVQKEDATNPLKLYQLAIIADAIAQVSKTPAEAARSITMGFWETGWNLRVHAGQCKKWECDHGLARGPWQVHKDGMPMSKWVTMHGIDHTLAQAQEAHDRIEHDFARCKSFEGAVALYMGGKYCGWRSDDTKKRNEFYERALAALRTH